MLVALIIVVVNVIVIVFYFVIVSVVAVMTIVFFFVDDRSTQTELAKPCRSQDWKKAVEDYQRFYNFTVDGNVSRRCRHCHFQ